MGIAPSIKVECSFCELLAQTLVFQLGGASFQLGHPKTRLKRVQTNSMLRALMVDCQRLDGGLETGQLQLLGLVCQPSSSSLGIQFGEGLQLRALKLHLRDTRLKMLLLVIDGRVVLFAALNERQQSLQAFINPIQTSFAG